MKRIFTLSIAAVLAVGAACAQSYRSWDFTHWSAQTVANLMADAAASSTTGWSDIEKKADAGEGKVAPEATANKCFWLTDNTMTTLTANGVTIAETDGLLFNATYCGNRSLAIAVDYPSTSLGEYAGGQYLWLGGGGKKVPCFTIPNVTVGQKITMTVESHKSTDARGVELYVGSIDESHKIGDSFKPTTQATYTWEEGWTLPEGVEPSATVDIIVYNTSGCHIYFLEVGDNSKKPQVAYLYGGNIDDDLGYVYVAASDKYTAEPVAANGTLTMDQLTAYDAIVISSTVTDADAISALKTIQPFVPTLNLNPQLYTAWGYGTLADAGTPFAQLKDKDHALFRDMEIIEGDGIYGLELTADTYTALTLLPGTLFANDDVLATAMESDYVAIHAHNMSRNGYLYVPYTQEALATAANPQLLVNAVSLLANTKAKVAQAPVPTFSLEYKNLNTNVTIRSTVPGAEIFYTTDGTEPTEQSLRYTEPFNVTAQTTVKAVARGDGYLLSDVAEKVVDIKHQLPAPAISVEQQDGKTIVDIFMEEIGTENPVTVYYNFTGTADQANSSVFTAPVTITLPERTFYAFASAEGYVDSEVASLPVPVQNPKVRIDVLSHMDANATQYNGGSTSTTYYFPWGKNKSGENGYSYFDPDDFTETTTIDPETEAEIITRTYNTLNAEQEVDFETGWALRSRGQIVDWENLSTGTNFGNTGGYNFLTACDEHPYLPVTKGVIVLADKNTIPSDGQSFPYNAYLVTTQKLQGPFDVVALMGSVTKPESEAKHNVVLQVAVDGNQWESNWQTLGDTILLAGARQTQCITRSYDGTDEVYVRAYLCGGNSKVGFYDIYITNEGELSQQLLSGIETIETAAPARSSDNAVYDLQGRRVAAGQMRPGIYIRQGRKIMVR